MQLGTAIVLGIWGVFAASVILRLSRRGEATFDDRFERRDRRLIGALTFYLGVPAAVLLSQLTQIGLLSASPAGFGSLSSWVFFGTVEPANAAAITAYERAAIAVAGPATMMVFVLGALLWTQRSPRNAAHNFLRLEFARLSMSFALGVHAIASLVMQRGDYWVLRTALNESDPPAGDVALLLFGVVAALFFYGWRRAARLRYLATPSYDTEREARARLRTDPHDADALRVLGAAQLSSGDPAGLTTLERALEAQPGHPRTRLLLGQTMLSRGDADRAAAPLRLAGQLLEEGDVSDEPLLFEVTLALSAARIMLGDAEGAILTAAAAAQSRPRDGRAVLMLADALVAGGKMQDARATLERGLDAAEGSTRRRIEQRLAALRRR